MEKSLNDDMFSVITENYGLLTQTIADAAGEAGRTPSDIRLMAVTKTVPPLYINHALSLGIELIGENKVQELLAKKDFLRGSYEAHLIGHLQTNKVRKIRTEVAMIQSVDSVRLAAEIDRLAAIDGGVTDILLEVNIGQEMGKTGFSPDEIEEKALEIAAFSGMRIRGLMAVPPVCETEKEIRGWFCAVRRLYETLRGQPPLGGMDVLSMGMSSDYREAILEGATLVRVGSALFGKRRY